MKEFEAKKPANDLMVLLIVIATPLTRVRRESQDHQNNAPEFDMKCIPNQKANERTNCPFKCDPALRMKEIEAKKPASDPMVLLSVILQKGCKNSRLRSQRAIRWYF